MQAATTATPRRHKPRRVIYKSTALEHTAPHLVAAAPAELVSAARSIQNASAAAERVRLTYKRARDVDLGAAVDGDDDASNAQKYERRLKMNRQSAAASRVRREAYTKALEAELVSMENQYQAAIAKLEAALERNRQLEYLQDDSAPQVKDEPEVDAVERVNEANAEVDLDSFEEALVGEIDFGVASSKTEALLADPCFADNGDVLEGAVPTTLSEWFLQPAQQDDEFL